MHSHSIDTWRHEHVFLGEKHGRHERRTRFVVILTAVMMVAEIVAGTAFGSMALAADGWHMATHVAALAITMFAYRYAARHARDARFSFGTGKFGELAGFASALVLGMVALLIAYESLLRFANPVAIDFGEATVVAVVGLAVNLASAWLLYDEDHHNHDGDHAHHHDSNIASAYMHVLADAFTSVLAIAALVAGYFAGWTWLDAAVGIVGAVVIANWSVSLMRASAAVLLDVVPNPALAQAIRARLEIGGDRVSDLHLWRLGPGHLGLTASLVVEVPQEPEAYKQRIAQFTELSHVTVEVHRCPDHAAAGA